MPLARCLKLHQIQSCHQIALFQTRNLNKHCQILNLHLLIYCVNFVFECGIICFPRFQNCSNSVVLFIFLDFRTVPIVFYYLFFQILELFQQCGIICFARFWNCSNSVVLFVFLDFGTAPTVLYYLFSQILEMLQQCGIICFSRFRTVPTVWYYLFSQILEMF